MTEDNANYSWDKDSQEAQKSQEAQEAQDARKTHEAQGVQRSQAVQAAYENEAKAETKKHRWWKSPVGDGPPGALLRLTMLACVMNIMNAWIIIGLLSSILYYCMEIKAKI
jgi:hypothetical protein